MIVVKLSSNKVNDVTSFTQNYPVAAKDENRYTFFLEKYQNEEKKILEEADNEIKKAQIVLENTSDPIKQIFLQSFINHHKYDCISKLLNYSKYSDKTMFDELDPLFQKIAEKVVSTRKYDLHEYLDFNYEKIETIGRQLLECGIVDVNYPGRIIDYEIRITNLADLNKIIKMANGRTLLTKEDKTKLNDFFNQREIELIGEHKISEDVFIDNDKEKTFSTVVRAYDALSSCDSKWEIISSSSNTATKSSANTLIDRKRTFSIYKRTFNYLKPINFEGVPFFKFENAGLDFYFYPEYFIAARSFTNFDVIPINDMKISFDKTNFIEISSVLAPKDAKFVSYTYKYVNKNGERDARYMDNPRYVVYEYGDITFSPYQLTMQFSNSEIAEIFSKSIKMLQRGKEDCDRNNDVVTEVFLNKTNEIVFPLCDFYNNLKQNFTITTIVNQLLPNQVGDVETKLYYLLLADLIKCYEQLGHDSSNIYSKEGVPMVVLSSYIVGDMRVNYDFFKNEKYRELISSFNEVNKTIKRIMLNDKAEDFFYLGEVFRICNRHDLIVQYFSLLYRFFSVVAKADDHVSSEESQWLEKLMSFSISRKDYGTEVGKISIKENVDVHVSVRESTSRNEKSPNPFNELQELIGLSEVKEDVTALANFVKIQQERENKGMKSVGMSYHCVFTGNPGTGKTTVARILAEIYRDLGILKKGHLIETDRSGLVAEYVGQTAIKTNKIIDSALDGILFIDEAYSLVQGGGNDYGQEAISTLLKRMEDDRDRLIVVLAGYSEDMKHFIDSNPGLQSRFNRYIHFSDYSSDELVEIFMKNVKNNQYQLNSDGVQLLSQIMDFATKHKDKNFGNGRFVRNLFEKTIQNQATRLSGQPSITAEELSTLKAEDLPTNK